MSSLRTLLSLLACFNPFPPTIFQSVDAQEQASFLERRHSNTCKLRHGYAIPCALGLLWQVHLTQWLSGQRSKPLQESLQENITTVLCKWLTKKENQTRRPRPIRGLHPKASTNQRLPSQPSGSGMSQSDQLQDSPIRLARLVYRKLGAVSRVLWPNRRFPKLGTSVWFRDPMTRHQEDSQPPATTFL